MFQNLKKDGIEEAQDRVGGFTLLESGIYLATVKSAYGIISANGAQGIHLELELEGGRGYREDIYVTNRNGENFFTDQQSGKKNFLPGFLLADDLAQLTVGSDLSDATWEDRVWEVYDRTEGKAIPKGMPTLVDAIGTQVYVAIAKKDKPQTNYDRDTKTSTATGEVEQENLIQKFMHPEMKITVNEARHAMEKNQDPEAKFFAEWDKQWTGNVLPMTRKEKVLVEEAKKGGGRSGRPGQPPQASNSAGGGAQKKSLFPGRS